MTMDFHLYFSADWKRSGIECNRFARLLYVMVEQGLVDYETGGTLMFEVDLDHGFGMSVSDMLDQLTRRGREVARTLGVNFGSGLNPSFVSELRYEGEDPDMNEFYEWLILVEPHSWNGIDDEGRDALVELTCSCSFRFRDWLGPLKVYLAQLEGRARIRRLKERMSEVLEVPVELKAVGFG